MRDDPKQIAKWLVRKHGLEAARKVVSDGLMKSQSKGNLYDVSVWREVRRILAGKKSPPEQ